MKKNFDVVIASVIDDLDNPNFHRAFISRVRQLVDCDLAMISLFENRVLASVLLEEDSPLKNERFSSCYQNSYSYSPFYIHYKKGISTGVYRMKDLARSSAAYRPQADSEEIRLDTREEVGYLTNGWPGNLREANIVLNLSHGRTAQVALFRSGGDGFACAELDNLSSCCHTLAALFDRGASQHFGSLGHEACKHPPIFVRLNDEALSDREREVIEMILNGLSVKEIAVRLAVGIETVRTYRKRAYQKLELDSKTSLFMRALELRAPSPGRQMAASPAYSGR